MKQVKGIVCIYWPERRNVTIERSLKFSNKEILIPLNLINKQIQGENGPANNLNENLNLQIDPKNESVSPKNKSQLTLDIETIQQESKMITKTDNQPLKQPSNDPTTEPSTAQSQRTRIPTRYVREIQSGISTTDGRPGRSDLPPGICISLEIEGENEGEGQIEHAMAVDIPKLQPLIR